VARTFTGAGYGMVFVFGVRAAGMYMITTTTLARQRALLPRAVSAVSYLGAAFLLVTTTFHPVTLLVFPGWVVLISVVLLYGAARPRASAAVPDPLRPSMTRSAPLPGQRTTP
jgi:chromate transport protein ChrA